MTRNTSPLLALMLCPMLLPAQVPGGDLWQIFVDDPNGVMIELNYEAAKEGGSVAPVETREDIGAR